jgi:hypothetical protein
MMDAPELVPIGRACGIVGRTPRTLRAWVRAGRLHEHRDAHGVRFYRLDELRSLAPQPVAAARGGAAPPGTARP